MSAGVATNLLQKHLRVLLQQHQDAVFQEQKKAIECAFWLLLDQALAALVQEALEQPYSFGQGLATVSGASETPSQTLLYIERCMASTEHWLYQFKQLGTSWLPERVEKSVGFVSAQIPTQTAPLQWPLDDWFMGFNQLVEEVRSLNQYD